MDECIDNISEVGLGNTRVYHTPLVYDAVFVEIPSCPRTELDHLVPGSWWFAHSELFEKICPVVHHHDHIPTVSTIVMTIELQLNIGTGSISRCDIAHDLIKRFEPSCGSPVLYPSLISRHDIDARVPRRKYGKLLIKQMRLSLFNHLNKNPVFLAPGFSHHIDTRVS
ncbi:hypothetical protein ES708_17962 [subsurface metagenome]